MWPGASFVGSVVLVIVGLVGFYNQMNITGSIFTIGFLSAIFDTLGKVCVQTAYANGPAGAVASTVEINNVFLVIIEAFRTHRIPGGLEILGFFFVIVGTFVLILS